MNQTAYTATKGNTSPSAFSTCERSHLNIPQPPTGRYRAAGSTGRQGARSDVRQLEQRLQAFAEALDRGPRILLGIDRGGQVVAGSFLNRGCDSGQRRARIENHVLADHSVG